MERLSFDFAQFFKNKGKKHKQMPAQFESVAGGLQKRLESRSKSRKSTRLTIFDSTRTLPRPTSPAPLTESQRKMAQRLEQLEKWKQEKEKKKKEAAAKKKKPFLVGVPSTSLKYVPPPPPPAKPNTGRVTRSQTACNNKSQKTSSQLSSFAPQNATFKPPDFLNIQVPLVSLVPLKKSRTKVSINFDPVLPKKKDRTEAIKDVRPSKSRGQTKTINTRLAKTTTAQEKKNAKPIKTKDLKSESPSQSLVLKTPSKPAPSTSEQLTPRNQVPKSESSSEQRLRSPKSTLNMTPEQITDEVKKLSPCVTLSRGKDNARREMKKKLAEGLLDEDTTELHNVDHFRQQLASEIKRMTEKCEEWELVLKQTVLPDSIQESIRAAVGQARLLMSQKLQQFAGLVEKCARPEPGTALITPADLHGFWDMVFMQIENVNMRIKNLEDLRARNWQEEQVVVVAKKKAVRAAKAKPTGGASRIKEMIAAARKAKSQVPLPASSPAPAAEKSFEAGFFRVTTPVRAPTPATPRTKQPDLLKAVLSSEANKSHSKNSASFAMLRASMLGKNAEYEGISPLPQTPSPPHLNATPGRSILKKASSAKKPCKVVLFNQTDTDCTTSIDKRPMETKDSSLDNQLEQPSGICDSRLSSVDAKEEKENLRKSRRLTRQEAVDTTSPIMTRSRRKTAATPLNSEAPQEKTPQESSTPRGRVRRSRPKSTVLADVQNNQ